MFQTSVFCCLTFACVYSCIISIAVFTPCDSHLSKIFRISCDIVSNPSFCTFTYYEALYSVNKVKIYWNIWSMEGHCIWSCPSMSCNIWERDTSYSLTRYLYQSLNFLRDDFKNSLTYSYLRSLHESCFAFRIKLSWEKQALAYHMSCDIKTSYAGKDEILLLE